MAVNSRSALTIGIRFHPLKSPAKKTLFPPCVHVNTVGTNSGDTPSAKLEVEVGVKGARGEPTGAEEGAPVLELGVEDFPHHHLLREGELDLLFSSGGFESFLRKRGDVGGEVGETITLKSDVYLPFRELGPGIKA
jgi:hypothetical protein